MEDLNSWSFLWAAWRNSGHSVMYNKHTRPRKPPECQVRGSHLQVPRRGKSTKTEHLLHTGPPEEIQDDSRPEISCFEATAFESLKNRESIGLQEKQKGHSTLALPPEMPGSCHGSPPKQDIPLPVSGSACGQEREIHLGMELKVHSQC